MLLINRWNVEILGYSFNINRLVSRIKQLEKILLKIKTVELQNTETFLEKLKLSQD